MQEDFHYYATYCAAIIAGYSHDESMEICYSAQFCDCCSRTFISRVGGPEAAATTQLKLEMMTARSDMVGIHDITRIWSSFHFLPRDLHADSGHRSKMYNEKYRLICGPNGELVKDTVLAAQVCGTLQAFGIAMHVLADTWAHANFAGTPSLVINNTDFWFKELLPVEETESAGENGLSNDECEAYPGFRERDVNFVHDIANPDDLENGRYTNSVYQFNETSIMNLGHGRAGHLPDYSFIRYRYMPAWKNYEDIIKDNPSDYYKAFCQMVYALRWLKGSSDDFAIDTYDTGRVAPYEEEIKSIIARRQLVASEDWKAFGEKLSGCVIDDFDIGKYDEEYVSAENSTKKETFLGRFFIAAIAHKGMVTDRISGSGNRLAGKSVEYRVKGMDGISDFRELVEKDRG